MRNRDVYPTVDIAIIDKEKNQLLLGRKHGQFQFRFIGGFIDSTDLSASNAALRELKEECGAVKVQDIQYLDTIKINDGRFNFGIITTFFQCYYKSGKCVAKDDIVEIKWFDLDTLSKDDIVKAHHPLFDILVNR